MNGTLCLSITGFSCYFSLARISSALMPSASSFFRTDSASVFFASSAALASAFAFFASSVATSFSAFFRAVFYSFRSAFKVSMLAVMDAISAVKETIDSCFKILKDYSLSLSLPLFSFPSCEN